MRDEVRSGLEAVEQLDVGRIYLEATAGLRGVGRDFAGYVRGEAGWRPSTHVSVFGYGEGDFKVGAAPEWQAGIGARLSW